MLHISDSERVVPLQSISYLGMTPDDLYAEALALKRANCPAWTDDSSADLGNQLLWLSCVLADMITAQIERTVRNSFIGTTSDREIMREICRSIGYTLSEAAPASATVTFSCAEDHPEFTIPAGTKVSTVETQADPAVIFETSAAQIVLVGQESVDILCVEGETIADEIIGSSDGTTGMAYTLGRKPVIWHSETIQVYDGAAWASWTRVDDFVLSEATDLHFRIEVDDAGLYTVIFGDGVRGRIPVRGTNNIRATYRVGGGVAGNVALASIVELSVAVTYVDSVTNATAASGGSDRETLEHARLFAPAGLRAVAGAVTAGDVETLSTAFTSSLYGGVANAKAYISGGSTIKVAIISQAGGLPSAGLKSALQTYLDTKRMICTSIQVTDPVIVPVDITISVTVLANYSPSQIAAGIRERLAAYLSPTYQDPGTGLYPHGFGRNIYLSDLYAIIDGATGVDFCTISAPTANIIIGDYEIADIGDLSITVTTPTGETSHYELGS